MGADYRPVPHAVAHALSTLAQPSGLTEFIRVYGSERGVFEWECHTLAKREAERKAEAEATLEQARQIAAENGWRWEEIEKAAREEYPQLFS